MSDRRYGYVDALKQAGLYRPELVCEVNFATLQQDVSSAIAYLKEQQADGLFAVTISISLAAICALHNQEVKIQEDMRLVCFDKSEVFDFMPHPPSLYSPTGGSDGPQSWGLPVGTDGKKDSDCRKRPNSRVL